MRYVIDFYFDESRAAEGAAAFHLDVRPGLDGVGSLVQRAQMGVRRRRRVRVSSRADAADGRFTSGARGWGCRAHSQALRRCSRLRRKACM